MAIEWRKVAMAALLADGKIDEVEVGLLRRELKSSEGTFLQEGVHFLRDLRVAAQKKAKARKEEVSEVFEKFFFKVVQDYLLKDGKISEHEAKWLRENLFADRTIDDREWALLTALNKRATSKSAGFTRLYQECEAARTKAAARK
jgi:hypothetical protein